MPANLASNHFADQVNDYLEPEDKGAEIEQLGMEARHGLVISDRVSLCSEGGY